MINRIKNDLKKYSRYAFWAAKSSLKCEVATSHLNWLWWILDPLLFMLVYSFVSIIVFGKTMKYFSAFIFIGLSIWNFFNKSLLNCVKIVSGNRSVVSKVYIPKYILVLIEMLELGFKMFISFLLVATTMCIYQVPVSWKIFYMIPIFLTLICLTFGFSTIFAHVGVFVQDFKNILTVILKMIFYFSGIFYEIIPLSGKGGKIAEPYATILSKANPMAFLINSSRQCMLYQTTPDLQILLMWFIFGIILSYVAIKIIYKYENTYVKVS